MEAVYSKNADEMIRLVEREQLLDRSMWRRELICGGFSGESGKRKSVGGFESGRNAVKAARPNKEK